MKNSRFWIPLLLTAALSACSTPPPTPKPPGYVQSGTWVVREDQVMRVAAGASGKGTLIYQGWQYDFAFTDAQITMTGNIGGDIEGVVYNLNTLRDFEGTYHPRPEYDEANHLSGLWARNDHGVTLHVSRIGQDVSVNFEATGATVTLVD